MPTDALVATLRAAGCVYAEEEAALLREAAAEAGGARPTEALEALVARRVAGEPLEQVVGFARFCGRRVRVAPGVFVPRRRTELLVREAAVGLGPGDVVLDLCCGTGAVGAALAAAVPGLSVYAADVDPDAVAVARRNLPPERVYAGDLYQPLPSRLRGRIAAVVANAPYVPTAAIATMPTEARDHEHRVALDGGADGLAVQRRLIASAPDWLAPGGRVLVETSRAQADRTAALMRAAGLTARVVRDEELDGTVAVGRHPDR